MNERQRYLTLCIAVALFCTLLYVPRIMFYDPPRVEWPFIFSQPTLKDKWGDSVDEGYMTSGRTRVIEWGTSVLIYFLLFWRLRSPKRIDSDK